MRALSYAILGLLMVLGCPVVQPEGLGAEATALALVKEGHRYIGEQAQDKLVQIRSEKSVGSVNPAVWHVVYYDPTATFKAVEVKFGAGKMLHVKRPLRLLEPLTRSHQPMDAAQIKIDSDKAIELALAEPILDNLTVKATSAKLERGELGAPVWKIRVWAAKLRKPNEQADLGEVVLSADDGKVVRNTLRIGRVD